MLQTTTVPSCFCLPHSHNKAFPPNMHGALPCSTLLHPTRHLNRPRLVIIIGILLLYVPTWLKWPARMPFRMGSSSPQNASLKTVRDTYHKWLIELFNKYAPAKKKTVEYLLDKYKGNEQIMWETLCAKYQKQIPPLQKPLLAISRGTTDLGDEKHPGAKVVTKAGKVSLPLPQEAIAEGGHTQSQEDKVKPPPKAYCSKTLSYLRARALLRPKALPKPKQRAPVSKSSLPKPKQKAAVSKSSLPISTLTSAPSPIYNINLNDDESDLWPAIPLMPTDVKNFLAPKKAAACLQFVGILPKAHARALSFFRCCLFC